MPAPSFKVIALALLACLSACTSENQDDTVPVATLAQVPGRHYSSLSVHPNSQELLFLEYRDEWPGFFRLQRYHMGTKKLQYYQLPGNHVYRGAAFSSSGNYIVLRRAANVRDRAGDWRKACDLSEIAVMRSDGTGFRVLPLSNGLKMSPVMSHNDRHIAYWRATQRLPGSKSFAEKFDVWEVDLQTGEDKPFGGVWEFFEGGQIQYLNNDRQIIFRTYLPTQGNVAGLTKDNAISWRSAYAKKHSYSFMYVLDRDAVKLPDPVYTGVSAARTPSLDAKQNLYFTGDNPKFSFFRMKKEEGLSQWAYPWNSLGQEQDVVAFSDGSGMAFIFNYKNEDVTRKGIALFDVKRETWTQINIPDFAEGTPIEVKTASVTDR